MHTHSVQGCLSLALNCECVSRMSRAPTSGGGARPVLLCLSNRLEQQNHQKCLKLPIMRSNSTSFVRNTPFTFVLSGDMTEH